jgi:hypothetical protein
VGVVFWSAYAEGFSPLNKCHQLPATLGSVVVNLRLSGRFGLV